jgi:xanthine dehydrogenase YagR molybdenum-binding subunit
VISLLLKSLSGNSSDEAIHRRQPPEQSVLDERNGRIVDANLAEYHVPTHADIGVIDVDVVAENNPYIDPLDARGIGESASPASPLPWQMRCTTPPAFGCAICPITVDKLLV